MSKVVAISLMMATIALLSLPPSLAGQANDRQVVGQCEPWAEGLGEFEKFVTMEMTAKKIPGLTIGFFKGDCTWIAGFGFADLENRVPATVASAYRYASVQKSMTAAAVLLLAERGTIDLDAEIQTYVAYFPRKAWPVTVRLLLGHLAGIPHYVNREAEQHIKVHKTTREAVAIFEGFDLVAEPGTRYSYSSYGYNLLGAAIEGAAAVPYERFMRETVWLPLGMTETRMDDPAVLIPNRARGYRLVNGELRNSEFIDVSSRFAAGGTRGTVPDLLRFVRGVQTGKLLSRKSLELVYAPMKTRDGRPIAYSAGWQIPPFANRGTMVVNDGGQQETRTFILNAPERGFGLALAMNLEADVYAPIVFQLYELVLGEKLVIERR
jgi:CubicO group peptidase (beta-lactamase class C family)